MSAPKAIQQSRIMTTITRERCLRVRPLPVENETHNSGIEDEKEQAVVYTYLRMQSPW